MAGQTGIEHFPHLLVPGERASHGAAVLIMLFDADSEGFHATQHPPAFKGRQYRARGFLNESKLLSLLRLAAHNDTAKSVTVAVKKLCRRVHHHVRAECQRLLKVGRHESV